MGVSDDNSGMIFLTFSKIIIEGTCAEAVLY